MQSILLEKKAHTFIQLKMNTGYIVVLFIYEDYISLQQSYFWREIVFFYFRSLRDEKWRRIY